MKTSITLLSLALLAGPARAADDPSPKALRERVEALRVENVAWRSVPWKSCLLEGLAEARSTGKPALLWVFIDRPVDDGRC
jgi:hypothetical protein